MIHWYHGRSNHMPLPSISNGKQMVRFKTPQKGFIFLICFKWWYLWGTLSTKQHLYDNDIAFFTIYLIHSWRLPITNHSQFCFFSLLFHPHFQPKTVILWFRYLLSHDLVSRSPNIYHPTPNNPKFTLFCPLNLPRSPPKQNIFVFTYK